MRFYRITDSHWNLNPRNLDYMNYVGFGYIDRLKFIFYGTSIYSFFALRYHRWRHKKLGYPVHPADENYYKFFEV